MKDRQVSAWRSAIALLESLGESQRIDHFLALAQPPIHPYLHALAEDLEQRATGEPYDGVATPFLTALHGLKEIGIGTFGQLAVGAERGFQIGQHFPADRYTVVVLRCKRSKILLFHGMSSEK